jgi:hypothetical protein
MAYKEKKTEVKMIINDERNKKEKDEGKKKGHEQK